MSSDWGPYPLEEDPDCTNFQAPFQLYTPFDLTDAELLFPRVFPAQSDEPLTEALRQRVEELTPPAEEKEAVSGFLQKVTETIENMMRKKETMDGFEIEEIRAVGSHRKGTIVAGHKIADMAIVFSARPTFASVRELASKLEEYLKKDVQDDEILVTSLEGPRLSLSNGNVKIHIYSSCLAKKMKETEDSSDEKKKIAAEDIDLALASIRHVRWMEEAAVDSNVKDFARILKDMRSRIPQLWAVTSWQCELLAHYFMTSHNPETPVSLCQAFQRLFKVMAAGLFLPDSTAILDPCEVGEVRIHEVLTLQQQDEVTSCFQVLNCLLAMGGYKEILGQIADFSFDFSSPLEYGGIRIKAPVSAVKALPVTPS